ncbi:MAG: pyruvate formate lyase-activating protein [Agathobacter sp.]|nr:pyruvate formate lyase-activating protein [Agathobacter sp.]
MGYIHSIQTFGTVDGPGVRFVVFFQGCPMRCQYCHNPDTWDMAEGKEKSVDEILEMFERNRAFYKTGGITATGGEPMMQMDFLLELFSKAKEKEIHTCLDTSGIFFQDAWERSENRSGDAFAKLEKLIQVTDLVMLDIKHIEDMAHKELTGHSNANILAFAKYLDEMKKPVWIRHVVVPGITNNEEQLTKFGEFLKTLSNVEKLEVLPYHTLGENKYDNLGIEYPLKGVPQLSKDEARKAEQIIQKAWGKSIEEESLAAAEENINKKEDIDDKSGGIVCRTC